jgi:hypothetical protein
MFIVIYFVVILLAEIELFILFSLDIN